jgi:hypothetical protein
MRAVRVLGFLILVMTVSKAADALPITLTAGMTATFNFDLTGKLLPPPFDAIDLLVGMDPASVDPGDSGVIRFFNEFNAIGDTGQSSPIKPAFEIVAPGWLDGLFSFTLTMTNGSIDIVDPTAEGLVFSVGATPREPPVSVVVSPEPPTLILLALGLVGVGALRWRQIRARFAAAAPFFSASRPGEPRAADC